MKKQSVKVLLLISFIGVGLLISAPRIPTTQAWGLATHMWLVDHAIDGMPAGSWKDAMEFFASDIKSGSITPDTVWQDWSNHLYYPHTQEYTAHIATERWFGYMVANLSIGNWKEGLFAAGVMCHYFADPNIPVHTDSNWPGHSALETDINSHLATFTLSLAAPQIIADPRQAVVDAATISHEYYNDCRALYPNEIIPSPSPLTTNGTFHGIIETQLERAATGIRDLWYTAIQGLEAPYIPPGATTFTVLIDTGHDNAYTETGNDQLTNFKASLSQWGINVLTDDDGITSTDLLGVDLLVITAPYIAFTASETAAIADWVENGTRTNLLVTAYSDFQNQYGFNRPTLNWLLANSTSHIRFNDDQIFNPTGYQLWYCDINDSILPGSITFNITKDVNAIRMYSTSSLWYTDPFAVRNITMGDPDFYQVDDYPPPITVLYDNVDDGVGGDFIPLMAVEEIGNNRIFASGTTFFSDFDYPIPDNEILIENALEWLLNTSLVTLDVFGPTISSVTTDPTQPRSGETVTVSATITDPAGIDNATLYYTIDGGSEQSLVMSLSGGQYRATIPANQVVVGADFEYYIKTFDLLENWRKTLPTLFTVSINPPTIPILSSLTSPSTTGNFTVSWSTSTDVDGSVSHYQLQMATSAAFSTILQEWNTTQTSQPVTNLSNGTYYFRIRAIDNEENPSDWSNTESITVAIPPPTTPTPPPPPIPGFPFEAIFVGLACAVTFIFVLRTRRPRKQ